MAQKINSAGSNVTFTMNREEFTLKSLLPGGWLSGDVINFFCVLWQPPVEEGVVIFPTSFWTLKLARVGDDELAKKELREKQEMLWEKVFKYRVTGHRRVRFSLGRVVSSLLIYF